MWSVQDDKKPLLIHKYDRYPQLNEIQLLWLAMCPGYNSLFQQQIMAMKKTVNIL